MKNRGLAILGVVLAAATAPACAAEAERTPVAASRAGPEAAPPTLADLLWVARPIVVFADTPADPRFVQQMAMLAERQAELEDRDVVVLTDTDPAAAGPLRKALRPRDFNLVLIDKDGTVAQRRPAPTSARDLINLIDRMPSRRQETGSFRN
jgi:Domain of unknown function (DUF4174)